MQINEPVDRPTSQPQDALRFITFELGGECFCVAATAVSKIVQPMQVSALPNSPSWLLGLAAQRGEIVAVIDPQVITPQNLSSLPAARSKAVIFHSEPDHVPFALPIDRLQDAISLPYGPPTFHRQPQNAEPFYDIEVAGRPMRVIDHESLFRNFSETPQ